MSMDRGWIEVGVPRWGPESLEKKRREWIHLREIGREENMNARQRNLYWLLLATPEEEVKKGVIRIVTQVADSATLVRTLQGRSLDYLTMSHIEQSVSDWTPHRDKDVVSVLFERGADIVIRLLLMRDGVNTRWIEIHSKDFSLAFLARILDEREVAKAGGERQWGKGWNLMFTDPSRSNVIWSWGGAPNLTLEEVVEIVTQAM